MKHSNPRSVISQSTRCNYENLTKNSTVSFLNENGNRVELHADMFAIVSVFSMRKFHRFSSDNVIQKSYAICDGNSILFAIPTPTADDKEVWSVMVFVAEGENAESIKASFKKVTRPYIKNSIDTIRDLQEWGVRNREQQVISQLPPELRCNPL